MKTLPNWRSLLFVPAAREKFVARAHERGADAIILDLEDSIAPPEKPAARAALAGAVPRVSANGAAVVVRINRPLEMAVLDIAAAVVPGVHSLMCTKVMGADHVKLLAELIETAERARGMAPGSVKMLALVEDAAAVLRMGEIAAAHPRLVGIGVGAEDLATDIQAEPSADALDWSKRMCIIAARAAGILPMGFLGTVAGFSDPDGYRQVLRRSHRLGFACTTCIHPSQVAIINEEYGVSAAAVDRARRLVAAFEAALAQGHGAVAFEGEMIDIPVVERARAVIARAR